MSLTLRCYPYQVALNNDRDDDDHRDGHDGNHRGDDDHSRRDDGDGRHSIHLHIHHIHCYIHCIHYCILRIHYCIHRFQLELAAGQDQRQEVRPQDRQVLTVALPMQLPAVP